MKKKILMEALSIALAAMTVFGCSVAVNAAGTPYEAVSPYYVNISDAGVSLTISGIKATCTAAMTSKSSMKLSIKMELQKEKSSGYETVETWSTSKTGTSISISESRLINALSDYRLKVTFTAGSETKVVYRY